MAKIGSQIHVAEGRVRVITGGISFGGRYAFSATESQPARVELAVWDEQTKAVHIEVCEGETFEFAGQTWRVDKIHTEGVRRWYADLTRIA